MTEKDVKDPEIRRLNELFAITDPLKSVELIGTFAREAADPKAEALRLAGLVLDRSRHMLPPWGAKETTGFHLKLEKTLEKFELKPGVST